MVSNTLRKELIDYAFRWSLNMIVEVTNNHGCILTGETYKKVKTAIKAMHEAHDAVRNIEVKNESKKD